MARRDPTLNGKGGGKEDDVVFDWSKEEVFDTVTDSLGLDKWD